MLGAVIGDIVGSPYEGRGRKIKTKDFSTFRTAQQIHGRHGLHGCSRGHSNE